MTDVPWTPGPWTFYAPTSWTDGLGYIRPKLEDGREIAHHGDTLRAPAENMANARLIAEAPAMAEALEHADATFQMFRAYIEDGVTTDEFISVFNATAESIADLLARIKGATP